jgi:predicted transcriptional regulator
MNASTQAETLALAKVDQKRLERLAEMAGRSPKAMLKFVLRDGFDAVEQEVRENLEAERDIELNGTVPHEEVMRRAKAIIEAAHARKRQKAA